ncbi:MAG: porin family protein [Cytophagaceae bacterium]
MKRLLLLLSFLCFGISQVNAQDNIEIGLIYVPQVTSIINFSHNDPIYQNRLTFAGATGLTFTYHFNNRFALQTGVLYNSHNQKFKSEIPAGSETREWKGKKRLDYLKLPLVIKYSMPIDRKMSFHLYAGPQLSYLLKGEGGVVVWRNYGNSTYYDLPHSSNDHYARLTIDGVLGFGLDFRITRTLTVTGGIRSDFSFTDMENKKATYMDEPLYYYGDPNRGSSHNFTVGFLMGISYRLGGKCLTCPSQKW